MRKTSKSAICIMFLSLFVLLCVPSVKASAASKAPSCEKTQTVYVQSWGDGYYEATTLSREIYIKNLSSSAKITSVKSNKDGLYVFSRWNNDGTGIKSVSIGDSEANTMKPGTSAKITIKVKQNGKTYTLTCKVTFKKASDYSKVSIGGKDYTSKANANVNVTIAKPSTAVKISVKMKSGRKLVSIELMRNDKIKTVKNGSKVTLKSGDILMISYKYTTKPKNYSKGTYDMDFTSATRIIVS
ncbi:MAG: hypothetical protein LIP12_04075 [Clostridiales bacterium]|nr:hypothetical protein [Clostridiales bacterium]